MTNQLKFEVDQVVEMPELFLIRVTGLDGAKIEAFMTMEEISGFLQSLGQQCINIAQQCQQILADKKDDEDSHQTPRILH